MCLKVLAKFQQQIVEKCRINQFFEHIAYILTLLLSRFTVIESMQEFIWIYYIILLAMMRFFLDLMLLVKFNEKILYNEIVPMSVNSEFM